MIATIDVLQPIFQKRKFCRPVKTVGSGELLCNSQNIEL